MLIFIVHFLISLVITRLIIWILRLGSRRPSALLIAPVLVVIAVILFDRSWLVADLVGALIATGMAGIYRQV